jgi:histone acetyltransferase (RNA polymerase elongator complex component)
MELTTEDKTVNIEDLIKPFWYKELPEDIMNKCYIFLDEYYYNRKPVNNISKKFINYQRQNKFNIDILKFGYLLCFYKIARQDGRYKTPNKVLEQALKVKNVREKSGVMVYSIFTSGYPSYTKINPDGTTEKVNEFGIDNDGNPGKYSCKYDCHYCPNYPDMPRSYLPGEPSVDRAIACNFEVFKMITERAKQYVQQGHTVDKAEVIIQGGTWDTYSYEYRTEFIRDVYYTFNVLMDYLVGKEIRQPKTMEEEIKINETAGCRVVGLTPETRPDQINYKSVQFLRKIGATRVQLGVQHLNDDILRHVNRMCYTKHTISAIQTLKDCGFKVDCHIMLDLPCPEKYKGKMPEIDRQMLNEFNTNPKLKVDQTKIYPCVVTPHTKIKEMYDNGEHKPYGELKKMTEEERIIYNKMSKKEKMEYRLTNELYKNIFEYYQNIHPSIRINRVFRDIPVKHNGEQVICGGTTQTSMRSELDGDLEIMGLLSNCIRYREAGNFRNKDRKDIGKPILKTLKFEASEGTEYFLTWESDDDNPVLYSFLRLRLSKNAGNTDKGKVVFPELNGVAIIREVHTYTSATPCKDNQHYYEDSKILFSQNTENTSQHKGFGKKLIEKAEEIAIQEGYKNIAVIAGVGVRDYYRKLGYIHDTEIGCFQIKNLVNAELTSNLITKQVKTNDIMALFCLFTLFFIIIFHYLKSFT